jgi:preprotein translocase subunit SecF
MMNFIDPDKKFNFTKQFKIASAVSLTLVLLSLGLVFKGLNYGVDFKGGAEIMVGLPAGQSMEILRNSLGQNGFSDVLVQSIGNLEGNEYLLKFGSNDENLNQKSEAVKNLLNTEFPGARIDKEDMVGPKAGSQLRVSGFQAMLWALIAIMIYVGLRFDFKYAPGAILALIHDVVIVLGVFGLFQIEFTLQIVAALLAVIGYSVNDTVIIYDRVREYEESGVKRPLEETINLAISSTLSRTILTAGTTLFVSIAMFLFGGDSIRDFFLAVSLGVIVGTYSSIFVAAPIVLVLQKFRKKNV